jgi:hypothetical protein
LHPLVGLEWPLMAESGGPGMSALAPLLGAKQTSVPQQ